MLKRLSLYTLLFFLTFMGPIFSQTPPSPYPRTLLIQAQIQFNGMTNYSGIINRMDVGIYKSYDDTSTDFIETFRNIRVANGYFTIILGSTKPLYGHYFSDDSVRIGFTPYLNSKKQPTEFLQLSAVPYAFHSEVSDTAEKIQDESLMKFDFHNQFVGINNETPRYTLDVGGTVNATTFVGDGAQLTNVSISDDRLVWLQNPQNRDNIYYITGNVGINTKTPGSKLDVSGNVIVSGNLTVRGLLQADALKGDGSEITNINASQINQGILNSERLNGDYPGITGIGTIVSGTWNGTEISDQYIDNTLTLTNAIIQGENIISGNFLLNGPTVITGNTALSIISKGWTISPTGNLSLRSVSINQTILISGNAIETSSEQGLHISPFDGIGMYISPTGSIGINTTTPATSFDVNGGIKLGASTSEEDGTIRFQNNRFEGFRKDADGHGAWIQLDYNSTFDSHALHAEGSEGNAVHGRNLIYINSDGHVGIGGIPSDEITDHLVVSGNAVFRGQSIIDSTNYLNVNGAGTRMIWYPRKAAFRAGYVEDTQWDDHSTIQNIGKNSVVFGNSGLASGNDTVIVGGIKNTISGKNSVIVGGYENTIDENSSYSVIVGGGSPNLAEGNAISNSIYSTIVGGKSNQIMDEGNYSTIIGGSNNTISGKYSVAMGKNISISHDSSFVFSDGSEPQQTTGDNQFLIYAKGGVGIAQAPDPNYALSVGGGVKAISFIGDGSQLTNISATKLGGFAPETVASKNSIYVSNADGFLPDNTVSGLSIVDGSITSHDIKDDSITGDQIAPFAITGDKIKPRTITSDQISDGAITADKIQEDAISGENIQNESIVSRNIAPNSIKTPHIADGQVTNIKIAPDTIDSSRIVDASITSKDIGLQAISSINIAEDAIQAHHIAYATIISDNISERAIQAQHLDDLIVSSRVIQDDAILSRHILNKNIQKDHIADGAIEGIHIADAVIINERIIDNSITSSKITPNAILGIHLPDDVIVSRHISEKAILEEHIADIAIGTEKIADNAIVSRNIKNGAVTSEKIAENAIETIHILDGTITSKDIQTMGFLPNEMIANNAIASINIADDAIGGNHIRDDQIGSNHIIDFSIVSRDIKDNAIAAHTAFANGTITSELIAEGAIQEHHITDNAITSRNIADGSIPWEKITTDPIPEASIADQSIPGSKIKDGTIPGSKIEDGTISSEKLADNSISTNALVGILSVEKGGTGLTQSDITNLKGSVLYGKDDNGTVRLSGDKNHLSWDQVNQRLGINTPTPLAALHVDGSILTTQGIYFGSMENSISFGEDDNGDGFIIIGPETDLSTAVDQSAVEPQGTLKTKQLYVREKVGIGIQDPVNALDVKGSMAIGSNFAGTRAPHNGLIVEGLVGIGVSAPEHALHVNGSIQAKSIVGKSDSDSVSGIGIKGIAESGAGIGIQSTGSKIGIDVDAKETGIRVVSEGSDGVFVTVKNAVDANAAGVSSEIWDASDQSLAEGVLGKSTGQFSAGVYGWADHSEGSNRWAAYFNGPVRIKKHLGIGNFSDGESPDAPLHVKGHSLFEKTVYSAITDPASTSIDWSQGNVQKYTCSSDTPLTFEEADLISGVYMLTLIVTVDSSCPQDISAIFPSGIKFSQGVTARNVLRNDTLFYSFFLDLTSASSPTYYGIDVIHTSGGGS